MQRRVPLSRALVVIMNWQFFFAKQFMHTSLFLSLLCVETIFFSATNQFKSIQKHFISIKMLKWCLRCIKRCVSTAQRADHQFLWNMHVSQKNQNSQKTLSISSKLHWIDFYIHQICFGKCWIVCSFVCVSQKFAGFSRTRRNKTKWFFELNSTLNV